MCVCVLHVFICVHLCSYPYLETRAKVKDMSAPLQLVMGTFILSYIGNSFVDSALRSRGPLELIPEAARRRALALLYFFSIFAFVTLLGVVTVSVMRDPWKEIQRADVR